MNQAETFEWLRERSNQLEKVEAELTQCRQQEKYAVEALRWIIRCPDGESRTWPQIEAVALPVIHAYDKRQKEQQV